MSTVTRDETLGEIVAADYRAAAVFERFGLDFCCGGKRTLSAACRQKGIDALPVVEALARLEERRVEDRGFADMALDDLVAHIVTVHHGYVRRTLPVIFGFLDQLWRAHGQRHPELARIRAVMEEVGHGLELHMHKEEGMLFPFVGALARAARDEGPVPAAAFGSVQYPILVMEAEHEEAAVDMRIVRELTSGYTPPPDGCATYRACFDELAAFEQDLHRHVHLENNILFPKAVALEQRLGRAV
jgi:regulator of cell morphogenesis and NO signaling